MKNSLFIAQTTIDTPNGPFIITLHQENPYRIISLGQGNFTQGKPIVRIHSSCVFSEVFHSLNCDCRYQLEETLEQISKNKDGGVFVYSDQEGRGLGLAGKFKVHELERQGMDTVESYAQFNRKPELREYEREVSVLRDLGVSRTIIFASNNPQKQEALKGAGFDISSSIDTTPTDRDSIDPMAKRELETKNSKMGYLQNQS